MALCSHTRLSKLITNLRDADGHLTIRTGGTPSHGAHYTQRQRQRRGGRPRP